MDELYQLFPFSGYKVKHLKIADGHCRVALERQDDKPALCHVCGSPFKAIRKKQRRTVEDLRMLDKRVYVRFTQLQGRCPTCRKIRLEAVDFVSFESPHFTRRYAFLLAQLCEISPVSNAAKLMGHGKMTMWRADLERMRRLFGHYRIPGDLTHLSVDEVYAKGHHAEDENRSDRFFTVITDLKSRKPIWVANSRSRQALDEFFAKIGPEACAKLQVVATDQHDEYSRSIKDHCPNAVQVFDRFHLMRVFENAVNDARKRLYKMLPQPEVRKLAKSKYKYVFLKADARRTPEEKSHMERVMKDNEAFYRLELIKERMLSFFDEENEESANAVFMELRDWIWESGIPELKSWWNRLAGQWKTLANYFTYRVTTALSEGVNNVIKSLKRQCYGFRNMEYFRLKILQRCGFLNSTYMTEGGQWTATAMALMGLTE
jgi:transposase